MTTVALAQLLIRHLDVTDLTGLEATKALEIVDAINWGVQTFFSLAPDSYSRTTISHRVHSPDSFTLAMTEGSNTVADDTFLTTHRGCSIVIDGDANVNEVTGSGTLLHDYAGTTGTREATLWYDAVAFTDFLIQQMLTQPTVLDTKTILKEVSATSEEHFTEVRYTATSQTPLYYTQEYVGGSLAAETDAVFQLRLLPRTVSACTLKFDAHILPVEYGLPALSTPQEIPIPSSLMSRLVVPLVEGRLTDSTMWKESGDKNAALFRAASAERRIGELPAYFARSRGRIYTKKGY